VEVRDASATNNNNNNNNNNVAAGVLDVCTTNQSSTADDCPIRTATLPPLRVQQSTP
jgi:hypothetical protein